MRRPIKRLLMQAVRARMVWFWLAGYSARDISVTTGTSVSTVYRWLRRCHKALKRMAGLAVQISDADDQDLQNSLKATGTGRIVEETKDASDCGRRQDMEPFKDLGGHTFKVSTVPYFPYVAYSRDMSERGNMVTLQDSLNVRVLITASATLNFTYEVWETPDRSFGNLNAQGQFNGLVGELQREETDFCLLLTPTSKRLEVIDYLRLEPTDYMVVLSEKPSLLSAVMSIMRPFSNELWVGLVVGLVVWSMTAWMLQLLWKEATGGPGVSLRRILMYGWGALLEQPPADPSKNFSGQMLVGWWLVFCLIIVTGFKSSLIAHLTVQAKSQTPEGLQDLVEFDNWKWGIEPWMLDGQLLNYFEKSTDQVVQEVYQRIEKFTLKELLQKVLEGRYSIVSAKNYLMVIIASNYVDKYGQMPFHIGREERGILACFGWGIRKGAPFLEAFLTLASRLEDAGLIKHWTEVVVAQRVKETRAKAAPKATNVLGSLDEDKEVILSMDHLQGAFYLLFLGSGVASITLLTEKILGTESHKLSYGRTMLK
ncbi:putative glutamate receptor [Portunus trituberculatus]|uniref:Putative glutamate receptor n=1 Tax=Portunus trituberculatus TaxID=210409 RepID=A0A5B7FYS3_PORTR|nr:putative glutamate receptor [Portunus trituberculatus]